MNAKIAFDLKWSSLDGFSASRKPMPERPSSGGRKSPSCLCPCFRRSPPETSLSTYSLARLNDAANARLNNLRNWPGSGDSAVLCEFLRADKRRAATRDDYRSFFKMEVFEPPCISVDVLDPRLASQLESTIGSSQMRVRILCLFRWIRESAPLTTTPLAPPPSLRRSSSSARRTDRLSTAG